MSKETFIEKRFSPEADILLDHIEKIIDEYEADGMDVTLRQVYYQLVSRDLISHERSYRKVDNKWIKGVHGVDGASTNAEPNYKWIGDIVSDARRAGRIDWSMVQDRGRVVIHGSSWENPAQIMESAVNSFRIDKWIGQPWHVEVMVEKQALEGTLIPVCDELQVRFMANKGYSSDSSLYNCGKRAQDRLRNGINVLVIYLGDHDPSGIDMTRDVEDRLQMFSRAEKYDAELRISRIALNISQIRKFRPPENPAKTSDSRSGAYIREFGDKSWELDSVSPKRLAELVRDEVYSVRDADLWAASVEREDAMKAELEAFAKKSKFK